MYPPGMPLFYFDHYENGQHFPDDQGSVFGTVEVALYEATRAMGGIAKEALPGVRGCELAIEVLDENRKSLFRTALRFEVQDLSRTAALIPQETGSTHQFGSR